MGDIHVENPRGKAEIEGPPVSVDCRELRLPRLKLAVLAPLLGPLRQYQPEIPGLFFPPANWPGKPLQQVFPEDSRQQAPS